MFTLFSTTVSSTTTAEPTVAQTTPTTTTTTKPSQCTEENIPLTADVQTIYLEPENKYALLECKDSGFMFPSSNDGAIWCVDGIWTGSVPQCIRKSMSFTRL